MRILFNYLLAITLLAPSFALADDFQDLLETIDHEIEKIVQEYNIQHKETGDLEYLNALMSKEAKDISAVDSNKVISELGAFYNSKIAGKDVNDLLNEELRTSRVKRRTDMYIRSLLRQRTGKEFDQFQVYLFNRLISEPQNRAALWMILTSVIQHNISEFENRARRTVFNHNWGTGVLIGSIIYFGYYTLKGRPKGNYFNRALNYLKKWAPKLLRRSQVRRTQQITYRNSQRQTARTTTKADPTLDELFKRNKQNLLSGKFRWEKSDLDPMMPLPRNRSMILYRSHSKALTIWRGSKDQFNRFNMADELGRRFLQKIKNLSAREVLRNIGRFGRVVGPTAGAYAVTSSVLRNNGYANSSLLNWWYPPSYDIFPSNEMDQVSSAVLVLRQQCEARAFYNGIKNLDNSDLSNSSLVDYSKILVNQIESYAFLKGVAATRYDKHLIELEKELSNGTYSIAAHGTGKDKVVTFIRQFKGGKYNYAETFSCPSFTKENDSEVAVSLSETFFDLEKSRNILMRLQLEKEFNSKLSRSELSASTRTTVTSNIVEAALKLIDEELIKFVEYTKNDNQFNNVLIEAIYNDPRHRNLEL